MEIVVMLWPRLTCTPNAVSQIRSRQLTLGEFIGRRLSTNAFYCHLTGEFK